MPTVALARNAMATRFELVLQGERESTLRAAGEEALAEVERIENQLSLYRSGSEIAQLNARAAREPVQVSPEVFALLQHAAQLSTATDGAFDITVAPLVRCWGFMNASGRLPTPEEVAQARSVVGMQHVQLDQITRTVRFQLPGVMLDLGAIGKGYALDRGADILREAGVLSALFHGGTSSVVAIGHPAEADFWPVALPPPVTKVLLEPPVLQLRDEALSVSAIWGRAFEVEGKLFGHVIDPRLGHPVDGAKLSAVILPSATETDALSTALLTLGVSGHAKVNSLRPGMRSLVVTAAGHLESLPS